MALSTQEISDRMEIEQLLIRYCHAIDERDWDTYLDRGDGETEMFFQGLWYEDELVRTPAGWKISKRAERNYFHNMPPGFQW